MDAKKMLLEMLDAYKYKIENNLCTASEIESASKVLMENMELTATISDIAKFYGKPETNVRVAINRRLIAKPMRNVVLYPFHKVQKVMPETWRKQ